MPSPTSLLTDRARVRRPARRLVNHPTALVASIVLVWVGCSMLYAVLEDRGPVESLWWGVVTGSTVGYGDQYPSTTAGRAVAVVLILAMLVLVPIAIGHVIAGLVHDRDQFSHDEQVALAETVESLHDRVEVLQHLLAESLAATHGEEWLRERLAAHAAAHPEVHSGQRREASGAARAATGQDGSEEVEGEDVDDRMLRLFRSNRS